jgi:hypothetical protein
MNDMLHFAKVFGICMAATMAAYVFVVFRWGFNVGVAWGTSRPPMWAIQVVFWFWPAVPALLIAVFWEILRLIKLRIVQ